MLVKLVVRQCPACSRPSNTSIIDIPLEEIRLSAAPVACECGYFREYEHSSLSFNRWKAYYAHADTDVRYYSNLIANAEGVVDPYLYESLDKAKEVLNKLGHTPLPDHLVDNVYKG